MTLTELKYIVAVARERHFGKAAAACFVSQPTLSVAVKNLEDELELKIFERSSNEVTVTPLGEQVVRQAQVVIDQAAAIRDIAKRGKDPLAGPLKLGVIYTIGPYLLPALVRQMVQRLPQMPLMLQENFTVRLLEMLKTGEIDCAILAEPFPDQGLASAPLYDEPFMAAVPAHHRLAQQAEVTADELKQETMLLLGAGHCFRDHVLEVCPEFAHFSHSTEGMAKSFEGSSLETIRHMVAAGMGVTLVPRLSVAESDILPPPGLPADKAGGKEGNKAGARSGDRRDHKIGSKAALKPELKGALKSERPAPGGVQPLVRYLPFESNEPTRRVVLVWRRSFTRYEAVAALRNAIHACPLPGVRKLT
jgi:LysR family transcriptional regulator, hydrogen peroxide-inducible genes activator